jgi:hypothetical protein
MIGLGASRKNRHIGKSHLVSLGGPSKSFEISRPGALHDALHIPQGTKIGQTRIHEATQSPDPDVRAMAFSAEGLTAMKKRGQK